MRWKRVFLLTAILTILIRPSFSEDRTVISLTLDDCVLKAIENNLNVAIQKYNPEIAGANLKRAREFFMPRFDLSYGRRYNENPPYWSIQGEETLVDRYNAYSFSIVQQIPTGGNLSVSLDNYRSETNQLFQLVNPRYGSTLRFDFIQPLLKNFGTKVSRREIIIAQNNLDISRNQFKTVLQDTIYTATEAYWNLVYAIENLKVKQQSLQLAQDLLEKNKKEVEVGKLARIEILNAEAVVASREADILQAELYIRKMQDLLRKILNITYKNIEKAPRIIPLDRPAFGPVPISLNEALEVAMQNRPDLMIREKNIENKELNLSIARNQMLPGLDLNFSYWSPGLSGDRLLYQGDNFFGGIVVGKEEGSRMDATKDALSFLYKNWTVGITLSIPLSSLTSKADLVRAHVELEQSLLERQDMEQRILLEIRDSVSDVQTNAKRYEAHQVARKLAEERLEAEEKKLQVGLTTNYFVLQFQEELASRRDEEIQALIAYNMSLAKLEKALGTSLEKRNIKIQ